MLEANSGAEEMGGSGGGRTLSSAELERQAVRTRQRIVKLESRRRAGRRTAAAQELVASCPLDRLLQHFSRTVRTTVKPLPDPAPPPLPRYQAPTLRWRERLSQRERLTVREVEKRTEEEKEGERRKQEEERRAGEDGGPKRFRSKFQRKTYQEELRRRTLTHVLSGHLTDQIAMRQEKDITVQFALSEAQKEIDRASKSMAEFLSQEQTNYQNLTTKLHEAINAKKKRLNQIENEKKKISQVKLRIFHQNAYLERMSKCREFVLKVAPEEWKENYKHETLKRQEQVQDEVFKLKKAFLNYQSNCSGDDPGLERALEDFIREYSTAGPPSLPYNDPHKIFKLFKDLEMKCLKALHHNARLKKILEKAENTKNRCDNFLEGEKVTIDNMLKEIKSNIEKEKKNVEEKKLVLKNMKIGPFRNMVASEEVLVEHILIRDVYEELIGGHREGLDTLEMVEEMGELYIGLRRRLESLERKERRRLELEVRGCLERGMLEGERAERRKRQIQAMVRGLRRAREKAWRPTGRPLLFKSLLARAPSTDLPGVQPLPGPPSSSAQLLTKEDLGTDFPLVEAENSPSPGLHQPLPTPRDLLASEYKHYFPDLQLSDTESEAALISPESDEAGKEGAKKKPARDPTEEKKKVKRKKPIPVVDSDDESN